jgi:hypothetical protein
VVHLRFAVLVFVLSGMPASAVLCDLLLCSPSPVAAEGCHEHGASTDDQRAVSSSDRCSHLSFAGPFLAAAHRESGTRIAPVASVDRSLHPELLSLRRYRTIAANVLPRRDASTRFVPLRI